MTIESDHPIGSALEGAGRRSDEPYSSLLQADTERLSALESEPRGRAPRISREDVFATADALLLDGIRPTIDRVRMRLGRGSPNTINDHLDVWWTRLGSRLRDLPGQEFPQLPERVAKNLHGLWNQALEAAHDVLQGSLARAEEALQRREHALEAQHTMLERDQLASVARAAALDDGLWAARAQLEEANQRARTLEDTLHNRDEDLRQLKGQIDEVTRELTELRAKQDEERATMRADRTQLQARHEAAEARWLGEVDRTRQSLKAADQAAREVQTRLDRTSKERDLLRAEVHKLRTQIKTAEAMSEQLESRLRAALERPRSTSPGIRSNKRRKKADHKPKPRAARLDI